MYSRWCNIAVIVLWLGTMSWLFAVKVLPQLLVGEPPNYRQIVEAQSREPPVGWRLECDGQPLGWALCHTLRLPHDQTEIHSWVRFDHLPSLRTDSLIGAALWKLVPREVRDYRFDAETVVLIDGLGQLSKFDSSLRINAESRIVHLQGSVEGQQMSLSASAGDFSFQKDVYLPPKALLGNALSPQTQLPGLRLGQSWKMPIYNPLRPDKDRPVEVLSAAVEARELIVWNGETRNVWMVVYRSDPGYKSSRERPPRGRLWVDDDGAVLKQESTLLDTIMTFTRMPRDEAEALHQRVGDQRAGRP